MKKSSEIIILTASWYLLGNEIRSFLSVTIRWDKFSIILLSKWVFRISKDDIVVVPPAIAHRIVEVFLNPDEFNPKTFLVGHAKDQIEEFFYLAFGDDQYSCLGEQFASLQVNTIYSILLRKFDFELCQKHPQADYSALVIGLKIYV